MKFTYEVIQTPSGDEIVLRSDGASIPIDERNTDYQRYLRWLENPDAEQSGTL